MNSTTTVRSRSGAWLWCAVLVFGWTIAASAQTITITAMNGANVPPDELFIPESQFPVFTVEWEASASAINVSVRVDDQAVFCDGFCSGTDGFFDLDQESFPGCRHTLQIVGTFIPGGTKFSQTVAWWSTALKECVGPPKSCEEGAGEVGRPVDVATGRMYHQMTDLVVQGPFPITFVRRYDSQSTFNGALGFGWRHSYLMRIQSGGTGRTYIPHISRAISAEFIS